MNAQGTRILKVNHAGEHGAVNIYRGQIFMARLTAADMIPELSAFKNHEERHRAIFSNELTRRGARRCASYSLCAAGGLALGLLTGLLGKKAIAATTVAVERVVLRHLEHQLLVLKAIDAQAVAAIENILDDERQHHDLSLSHANEGNSWSKLLTPIVAASTESVIWLGMRL